VHGRGIIFQGFERMKIGLARKRLGSVTWRWAENGKVFADESSSRENKFH
jgi:hypothetical protein